MARMHPIALAVAAVALTPATQALATTKSCGDEKPYGITRIVATDVGCPAARTVARNYNTAEFDRSRLKGWTCRGKRISSARESVTCRKTGRRITFRSTYQVELPAAYAPPST